MKKFASAAQISRILFFAILAASSQLAQAEELSFDSTRIEAAHLDHEEGILRIQVSYSGGCEEHRYALEALSAEENACESEAELTQTFVLATVQGASDPCRAYLTQELSFELKDHADLSSREVQSVSVEERRIILHFAD